jgi:hypothetical protein
MSLTPGSKLSGVLPVVVSGGRPLLRQRPTGRLLADLHGVTADPVWVVSDLEAAGYEDDGHEIVTYSREWAEGYAAAHWTAMSPPEPGGFLGAFPGREHACRVAEERGCWGVLQLDDNILQVNVFRGSKAGHRVAEAHGRLALHADVLSAVTLSTNGRMTGAFLDSVRPSYKFCVARVGFPYSLFLERTGPGREEWFGPYEDDITHAIQYGASADAGTALVVPVIHYRKDHGSRATGMRASYNHERSVPLQRMFPESAKVTVIKSHSNGRGGARVFHKMAHGSIRTPMVVTDRELYGRVNEFLAGLGREFTDMHVRDVRDRVKERAARWGP